MGWRRPSQPIWMHPYKPTNSKISVKIPWIPIQGIFFPQSIILLGVAQLAERLFWEQEAVGSRPTTQTIGFDA